VLVLFASCNLITLLPNSSKRNIETFQFDDFVSRAQATGFALWACAPNRLHTFVQSDSCPSLSTTMTRTMLPHPHYSLHKNILRTCIGCFGPPGITRTTVNKWEPPRDRLLSIGAHVTRANSPKIAHRGPWFLRF
jgi:hypothetical protein